MNPVPALIAAAALTAVVTGIAMRRGRRRHASTALAEFARSIIALEVAVGRRCGRAVIADALAACERARDDAAAGPARHHAAIERRHQTAAAAARQLLAASDDHTGSKE